MILKRKTFTKKMQVYDEGTASKIQQDLMLTQNSEARTKPDDYHGEASSTIEVDAPDRQEISLKKT